MKSQPVDASNAHEDMNQLPSAEMRLRAVLDAAVDAIITIDEHGIIESVNTATERMFGYSSKELLGRNVSMLMPPRYGKSHDDHLQRYLRSGVKHIIGVGREVEALRRDGTVFPADLAVSEMVCGGRHMFTGLIRDISDRRAAERAAQDRLAELARAGRLADLGLTTSTIAHEVNQPLAAIVSFAHACQRMLKVDDPDRELMRAALSQIAEQGERASAIITRIREMARKRARAPEHMDLNEAVRSVLDMLTSQLRLENIRLETRLMAGLPPVHADRVQIEQVIVNLVTNAMDAMREVPPHGRRLEVATRQDNDMLSVLVRDTGPGLSDNQLERVFDSFYSTKPDGMGVGLSICRSLIEAHGGRLWVERSPGPGASFRFNLPAQG